MGYSISGVTTLAASGSAGLSGNVTLSQGTNITLTQTGQDIAIAAAGGASGMTQLGETILTGALQTITVSGLTAKLNLMGVFQTIGPSAATNTHLTFNGDERSFYSSRGSTNGAADTTSVTAASIGLDLGMFNSTAKIGYFFVANRSANEKGVTSSCTTFGNISSTAPDRNHGSGNYINTGEQITKVVVSADAGVTLAVGSRLTIYGGST